MANKRSEQTGYRPFRTEPLLADGLLPVAREGGDFLARVSEGLFNLAAEANQVADRQAARAGQMAGEQAALAGRPGASVEGGKPIVGGHGKARGGSFAPFVNAAIDLAAARHGVDAATLRTIAQIESGGNPRAKNPTSSAGGLFQFIDSTARQFGLADRYDPQQASDAAARLMKANASHLRRTLGREPTPGELYLAHQQGPGGAEKLLKNPNARAVDVVGAAAVRLNGGRPNMTAGQFANLWISKAENGYVMPSNPDQLVGPAGGAEQAATAPTVTLTGGSYRPSGQDTIYGRAYDEAGARTYASLLETEMRSTTGQIFERYKDDPAGLEKALGDLKGQLVKDHVFPEIQADFEVGYGRIAESYLGQARENATRKAEQQDRAAFIERTGELETDQSRRLAEFDAGSATAADAIASSQQAIDQHYDDAVRRGIMDPDDAARAKLSSRREAALGFYGKQAEAKDADGVAAMREAMRKDFADGGIEGLDGDGWQTLDAGLAALTAKKKAEQARAAAEFRKTGAAFAARVAAGYEVDQAALSAYMLDAGKSPEGKKALEETLANISAARAIRDMPLRDGEKHVAGLRRQYGDSPTDTQLRRLAFAEDLLAKKKQAITKDAVSYAEAHGIVPATPMLTEAQDTAQMADIMQARVDTASEAASQLGVTTRYLKAGEAKAVADAVRRDPAAGAGIAGAIVAGAGDKAAAVLSEFGQDAPMIAESGAIIAFGGSARAAEDVILGYGKGADGKKLTGLKPDAAKASFDETTGAALATARQDRDRIARAAAAIARKRISEEGVDPTSDEALAIHRQAVNEAAGGSVDGGVAYGGFVDYGVNFFGRGGVKVLVPPGMRADQFEDTLLLLNDADIAATGKFPKAGLGYGSVAFGVPMREAQSPARTLKAARPVAVSGGYAFAMGDPAGPDPQWIAGQDGKPYVLDIMSLRDRLAARAPGAFR